MPATLFFLFIAELLPAKRASTTKQINNLMVTRGRRRGMKEQYFEEVRTCQSYLKKQSREKKEANPGSGKGIFLFDFFCAISSKRLPSAIKKAVGNKTGCYTSIVEESRVNVSLPLFLWVEETTMTKAYLPSREIDESTCE